MGKTFKSRPDDEECYEDTKKYIERIQRIRDISKAREANIATTKEKK